MLLKRGLCNSSYPTPSLLILTCLPSQTAFKARPSSVTWYPPGQQKFPSLSDSHYRSLYLQATACSTFTK
jgi:hypothetical protein